MKSHTNRNPMPSKAFTQIVNRMDEKFRQLEGVLSRDQLLNEDWPNGHRRQIIEQHVVALYELERRLRKLEAFWLPQGTPLITGVPESTVKRYSTYVESRRADIPKLFYKLMDFDIDLELEHIEDERVHACSETLETPTQSDDSELTILDLVSSSPERDAFQETITEAFCQFKEMMEETGDADDELDAINDLIRSSWFTPQQWWENAHELRLTILPRRVGPLNQPSRAQLFDLYKAAVTGNYTATIALARSVTEGVLVERQRVWLPQKLRIDGDSGSRSGSRLNSLLDAYERAGVELPFDEIRRTIQRPGNAILHSDNYVKWRRGDLALDAVNLTARVLTRLHAPR